MIFSMGEQVPYHHYGMTNRIIIDYFINLLSHDTFLVAYKHLHIVGEPCFEFYVCVQEVKQQP